MLKYICTAVIATILTVATPAHASTSESGTYPFAFTKPYSELLKKHTGTIRQQGITTMGVDYKKWGADPLHKQALALLQKSDTKQLKTKEREIAFWINTFNFLVIDLITHHKETGSIQNLGGIVGDPWNEFTWEIDNKDYTLQQISAELLGYQDEPRVYFALSRAALSAPALKQEPYHPDNIYTQLEEQAQAFMDNTEKAMQITKADNTTRIKKKDQAKVSQIFSWHKAHFNNGDIRRYIMRYHPLDNNTEISGFIPFNWSLNTLNTEEAAK